MTESPTELTTTADVIRALGGVTAVAAITGRKYSAAFNWQNFTKFPANTYVAMTAALKAKGCTAPASLWGMVEAKEPEQVAS